MLQKSALQNAIENSSGNAVRDVTRLKFLQNSGAFRELFRQLLTKTEKFCAILKKFWSFLGLFLGAFGKYVEILCYFWKLFQPFDIIRKLFGAFLTNFENSTEILCYFLKPPEFGRSPEIRKPATPLNAVPCS